MIPAWIAQDYYIVFDGWIADGQLEEDLALARDDFEMWCLIANYADSNLNGSLIGKCTVDVIRRMDTSAAAESLLPITGPSLEVSFSTAIPRGVNHRPDWHFAWYRQGVLTLHSPGVDGYEIVGVEAVRAFILEATRQGYE